MARGGEQRTVAPAGAEGPNHTPAPAGRTSARWRRRLAALLAACLAVAGSSVVMPTRPGSTTTSSSPATYLSLPPARVLDTRNGTGAAAARLSSGQTLEVVLAGRGGVPTTGVDAVAINLTAVAATEGGHAAVFPTGSPIPNASTLNFSAGQTVAGFTLARLGTDGQISINHVGGSADYLIDVAGYVPTGSDITTRTPVRLLDTRIGNGAPAARLASGQTLNVQIAGRGGVPATGSHSVTITLTAVAPSAAGHATVFPTGSPLPNASTLNFSANRTVANFTVAKLGTNGQISINHVGGSADYLVDVVGHVATASAAQTLTPARLLDTRVGNGAALARVASGQTLNVLLASRGGIPATGVDAVAVNLTAVTPSAAGHATVFPTGTPLPGTSTVNFSANQTVASFTLVQLGTGGQISIRNVGGTTDYLIDVVGFVPRAPGAVPTTTTTTPTTPASTSGTCSPVAPDNLTTVKVEQRYPASGPVVKVLGDSLTYGAALYGDITTAFAGYDLEVNGQSSRATPGGAWLIDQGVLNLDATTSVVVVALGTNDLYTTCYGQLADHVTQSILGVAPNAKVLWVGPGQWTEAMTRVRADLTSWHDGARRVFLDWDPFVKAYPTWLSSDGVHLTREGYQQRNVVVAREVGAMLAQG